MIILKDRGVALKEVLLTPGSVYFEHGNNKCEARERRISRNQNNSNRVVRNLEERNVSMEGKSFKQSIISVINLIIELPERRQFPYHKSN